MKVKFLKAGRFAHSEVSLGQFDFAEGDEINGISEKDAKRISKAGLGEIIGVDDIDDDDDNNGEVEEGVEANKPDSDDPNVPDADNSDKKTWE